MKKPAKLNKLNRMNLDVKLRIYTTVLIIMITVVMLSISATCMICTSYQMSQEAAESKLSFVADSYGKWLEGNRNTLLSLQLSQELQTFCSSTEKSDKRYIESRSQVVDRIENLLASNLDINFISVTNGSLDTYVYRGNHSITNTRYDEAYKKGLEESQIAKEKGTTRINFGNDFFGGAKYSVTFYQPVYSVTIIKKQIGMVCMNVNDTLLKNIENLGNIETTQTYLVDMEGSLISESSGSGYEENLFSDIKRRRKGSVSRKSYFYFFQKLNDWNYYILNAVPRQELYKSSVQVACIMIGLMIPVLIGSIYGIRKMVQKSYEQVSCIIEGMDHIARNEMDYRIETSKMGEDFQKLGKGFNHMTDEISKLMVKIRQEQYQLDQIRFQALQSQIQPHFLYNTLECIHWQSFADGNKQVSKLVMALASYYRLSLSKGKDIVTLKDELSHIQYYMFIQNQRFGDLVACQTEIEEGLKEIPIPKLTLQPLVENAIYHGIGIKEGNQGIIYIKASQKEEQIIIEISDTGGKLTQDEVDKMNQALYTDREQFGYGVRNVNKRIGILFGHNYGLSYALNESKGATAFIKLPVRKDNGKTGNGGWLNV